MNSKYRTLEYNLRVSNPGCNFYLINVNGNLELYYDRVKITKDDKFKEGIVAICESQLGERLHSLTYTSPDLVLFFSQLSAKYSIIGLGDDPKELMELLMYLYEEMIDTSVISPSEHNLYRLKCCLNNINSYIEKKHIDTYLVEGLVGENTRRVLILCSKMLKTLLPRVEDNYYRSLFIESSDLYMNIATTVLECSYSKKLSSF